MFKPPKTSLLAAFVVAAGCKGGATGTPMPPGKHAEPVQPAPTDPDEHAVGDWAPEPDKEEPVTPDKLEEHKVGKTAKPDPTPHKVGIVAKPIEDELLEEKPKPADPE